MTFRTWQDARTHAEKQANSMRIPHGIEFCKYDNAWVVRMLPPKDRRFGFEARIEAVEPV